MLGSLPCGIEGDLGISPQHPPVSQASPFVLFCSHPSFLCGCGPLMHIMRTDIVLAGSVWRSQRRRDPQWNPQPRQCWELWSGLSRRPWEPLGSGLSRRPWEPLGSGLSWRPWEPLGSSWQCRRVLPHEAQHAGKVAPTFPEVCHPLPLSASPTESRLPLQGAVAQPGYGGVRGSGNSNEVRQCLSMHVPGSRETGRGKRDEGPWGQGGLGRRLERGELQGVCVGKQGSG